MIRIFKCGHEGTVGFWKDDAWFKVGYDCPECKRNNQLRPGFQTFRKGSKTLVIKLARVAKR